MSEDQINEEIAYICGYRRLNTDRMLVRDWRKKDAPTWEKAGKPCAGIPKFCDDLNAMHEAEELLSETDMARYMETLARVVRNYDAEAWVFRASAYARATAFLLTLDKWEDAL